MNDQDKIRDLNYIRERSFDEQFSKETPVLNDGETYPKIERSGLDWAEILPIVPIPVFFALFLVLAVLDVRTVFEPTWLLPLSNVLFLFIVPLTVVYVATQGYLQSSFITLLILGAGVLTFGLGAVLAGSVLSLGGPNATVTVHNVSALLSALLHVLGSVFAIIGLSPQTDSRHRKLNVTVTYLGIVILMALLTIATLTGLIPIFFVQGEGPTVWRQTVLATSVVLFIVSGIFFVVLHLFSKAKLLYWYSLALFLIATGLICILFQKSVGTPIGWLGRGSHYLAGTYLLVAVVSARRDLRSRGLTMEGGIADMFRHRLAMLVEERTFQLRRANEQLSNEVAERKKAELALHESEYMLRAILSTSPVGIAITKNRRVEWANEVWKQMLGFAHEHEYLGQDVRMLYLSDEQYERTGKLLYEDLETGKVGEADTKFRRADGSVLDVHVKMKALDPLDPAKGTISAVSDISLRKKAEEALRESEEKFRNLFNNAEIGMFRTRLDGYEIVDMNEKFLNIFGRTHEEMQGKPSVLHWVDPREREEMVRRLNSDGRVADFECKMMNKRGEVRTCLTSLRLYREQGILEGSITDITERKESEEALRRSEDTLRALVEEHPESVLLIDPDGTVLACSHKTAQRFGRPLHEVLGLCAYDFLPADVAEARRERVQEVVRTGKSVRFEDYRLGRTFDNHIQPISGDQGEVVRLAVLAVDITNLRKAEEAQRRLATAIEQSAEAVVITDLDGAIQYANPATEHITGFECSEIVGSNPRIFKSGEHGKAFYEQLWNTITAGNVWSGRIINKKKDGTLYHEDATISPVRDASGKTVNFVAVKRDVSKEVSLQKQLLQAQKMEAIGTLAKGVAHDFNNLLTVVMGFSELLLADKDEGDSSYADLKKIHQAGQKGADLVRRLLAFSRKSDVKPRPLNLNRQIEQLREMMSRTIPKMINIDIIFGNDLKLVNADPTQMDQILMNLAINAEHAMTDGGTLTIETRNVVLDDEYCRLHVGSKPGDYVLLRVSDTGHGMDNETLKHVFEPFFTKKGVGRGTGLGLAMVYGIVKQHDGYITCNSESGHGTTFNIYLPAFLAEREQAATSTREPMPGGGRETVLLVDDEEYVRDLGKRILERSGYTVLTAANGKEALELYKRERTRISLVILDLIMPEMGGMQCLEELLKIAPKARVLIASGFAANGHSKEVMETGARGFVAKPYNVRQMLQAVRGVLDRG